MVHAQTRYYVNKENVELVLHYVKNVLFPLAAEAGCRELQTCILPDKSAFIAKGIWPSHQEAEYFAQQLRNHLQQDLEGNLIQSPVRELFEFCYSKQLINYDQFSTNP